MTHVLTAIGGAIAVALVIWLAKGIVVPDQVPVAVGLAVLAVVCTLLAVRREGRVGVK